MNIDTRILGYYIYDAILCTRCAEQDYPEAVQTPAAHVINVYNSSEWLPNGCYCDFCGKEVVERIVEDKPDLSVFEQFLDGLDFQFSPSFIRRRPVTDYTRYLVEHVVKQHTELVVEVLQEEVDLIDWIPEEVLKEWAWNNGFIEPEGDR